MTSPSQEAVVLVHGIGSISWSMIPLAWRLQAAGYRVVNWGFPSWGRSIPQHAERLTKIVEQLESDPSVTAIHFVGHSMGAIICRAVAVSREWTKVRRLALLAPPNRGVSTARRAAPLLAWFIPPVAELSDDPHSYVNQLPWPDRYETAVLTARYDSLVIEETAHVPGERAFQCFGGIHSWLIFRSDVARALICFLKTGTLKAAEESVDLS